MAFVVTDFRDNVPSYIETKSTYKIWDTSDLPMRGDTSGYELVSGDELVRLYYDGHSFNNVIEMTLRGNIVLTCVSAVNTNHSVLDFADDAVVILDGLLLHVYAGGRAFRIPLYDVHGMGFRLEKYGFALKGVSVLIDEVCYVRTLEFKYSGMKSINLEIYNGRSIIVDSDSIDKAGFLRRVTMAFGGMV